MDVGEGNGRPIVVAAVGDIMPGDSAICVGWGMASRWPAERYSEAIASARGLLQGADIVIGNLEAPLSAVGEGGNRWARDQMRADPRVAQALQESGFNLLGVANNHAEQHGRTAFETTVAALRREGVAVAGLRGSPPWSCEPVTMRTAGGDIGVLAYCWRPRQYGDGIPSIAEGDLQQAVSDIRRLRDCCHAVIVSLHWGEEFVNQPSCEEVEAAGRLMDAGAALVIGHHPHVVRPLQRLRNGLAAYSLGNFSSDMIWMPELRFGAVLRCTLCDGEIASYSTSMVRVGDDFRCRVVEGCLQEIMGDGVAGPLYEQFTARGIRRQRRHAYAYALRNFHRFQFDVFAELFRRTVRNKIFAVWPGVGG